jgi:hypothetical protein
VSYGYQACSTNTQKSSTVLYTNLATVGVFFSDPKKLKHYLWSVIFVQ